MRAERENPWLIAAIMLMAAGFGTMWLEKNGVLPDFIPDNYVIPVSILIISISVICLGFALRNEPDDLDD